MDDSGTGKGSGNAVSENRGAYSTQRITRKIAGPIVEAMRKQCTELAERELIRTFGYDASSVQYSRTLIEKVAEKAVDQFAEGGWINGLSLPQIIRNELLVEFGGIEYIRAIVHEAFVSQSLRPDKIAAKELVMQVTGVVIKDFAVDNRNTVETVGGMARKRLREFLMDIDTHTKDEFKGESKPKEDKSEPSQSTIERLTGKRLKGAQESSDEQERRGYALAEGMNIVRNSKKGKAHILEMTMSMMTSSFPPEMFTIDDLEHPPLTVNQQNDLAINFLFWTLQNNAKFTSDHRLVVYLIIWKGMTEVEMAEEVRIYEEKDEKKRMEADIIAMKSRGETDMKKIREQAKKNKEDGKYKKEYGLTTDRIKALYEEVTTTLKNDGEKLLDQFLAKMNPLRVDNEASIGNYSEVAQNIRAFIKGTSRFGAADLQRTYTMSIEFPQTEYEKTCEETDIILLQHGNITARSRALVRILRMIGNMVNGSFGKYWVQRSGTTEDFSDIAQGVAEVALKKLVKFNPMQSRISTYMMGWIKSIIRRYVVENDLVTNPVHIADMASFMYKNPDMPDEEIAKRFKASLATVTFVRNERKRGMVWIDEPLPNDEGDGSSRANYIPELSTGHNLQLRAMEQEMEEQLIQAVLRILPAREAEIIRMRFLEEMTLEEVGDYLGITRERVRQVEEKIIEKIQGEPESDTVMPTELQNIILIVDQAEYEAWMQETFPHETDRRITALYMGLDVDLKYERCVNKRIIQYLTENGIPVNETRVSKTIKIAKKESYRTAALMRISRDEAYRQVREIFDEIGQGRH